MSPCDIFDDGKGGRYYLCHRGGPGSRSWCAVEACGNRMEFLCDGPPPARAKRKTCDFKLCRRHAHQPDPAVDRHLCPGCVAAAAAPAPPARTAAPAVDQLQLPGLPPATGTKP